MGPKASHISVRARELKDLRLPLTFLEQLEL
jgi:hypothetical protein